MVVVIVVMVVRRDVNNCVRVCLGSGQQHRRALVHRQIQVLGQLTAEGISVDKVAAVQAELLALQGQEEDQVRVCQEGLERITDQLTDRAARRVEALRKELHVYGALHLEPDLKGLSASLSAALADPALAELFRVGGGLKVSPSPYV